MQRLELWGGVECTLNRIGDGYRDQLVASGHHARGSDLDAFARLGIRRMRYPVLWERVAPEHPDEANWDWSDERLARLHAHGIDPIIGLLHHGSGPRYTSLIDPEFPVKLARYARQVAERYPWVTHYTPVNEPLTTARFSGLYGHWYPHARDDRVFLQCLTNQCVGIARAMEAIREVRPDACLVLTEDLGWTSSSAALEDQAAYENARRWLSVDLLCGRVTSQHPLWPWLMDCGADRRALERLAGRPHPPDLFGVNHYVTSNRHLDDALATYPAHTHGGNGRQAYADVEAVRVADAPQTGRRELLREAWDRYGIPLALTESHLCAGREDQLRWLNDAWQSASGLRTRGIPVEAVTIWSLLGTIDWSSLAMRCDGHYECGAFDIRGPEPRRTAIATMAEGLARHGAFEHPILTVPGWWARPCRVLYPERVPQTESTMRVDAGGILIAGARGTLGRAFARQCAYRGLPVTVLTRAELDIADASAIERALDRHCPWAVINAAGYVRVDEAEDDRDRCRRENVLGPEQLALACARHRLPLVTFSSDLVFDGKREVYVESDPGAPLNYYGRTKWESEQIVQERHPAALVVRTSAFFGPWDEHNFVTLTLRATRAGQTVIAAEDVRVSPTYVPELVDGVLDLLIDSERGVWHLANPANMTWFDFARAAVTAAGHDPALVEGRPAVRMGWRAARPRSAVLQSERGMLLRSLDLALKHYLSEAAL